MNSLLISDLHLTDKPRDEYRWRLFEWLRDAIMKHEVRTLFILGDLTDAKDYHSARLVNRIVVTLLNLYKQTHLHGLYILRGNHDGIDPKCPYFQFLGLYPSIKYVGTPYGFPHQGREIMMLPHTNDPLREWYEINMRGIDTVFMHATVRGAVAENGQALEGVPPDFLRKLVRNAEIYSGDIHVPQNIGGVEYVGAPYPVRFGDSFSPRAVLLNRKGFVSVDVPGIHRRRIVVDASFALDDFVNKNVDKGDQIKVIVRLEPSEFGDWERVKKNVMSGCAAFGLELCGMELEKVLPEPKMKPRNRPATNAQAGRTPEQVLTAHCEANKLGSPILQAGLGLLKGVDP